MNINKLQRLVTSVLLLLLFSQCKQGAEESIGSPVEKRLPWDIPDGFVIELVATDLFLPVNIAFVPNPQPDADTPLYYITELYGKVKVVLRNGNVLVYAENLLNFSPTGNFPGSGEMGVSGIVVEPGSGDLFVTMVYDDNGIKNKVVGMHSMDGGRSAGAMTTLIDGIPGPPQSHQIHQATIGPDGKLYVQIGDGFNANAAQRDDDLRGKILRMNLDGSMPEDNPLSGSYVYAKGVRNPFGGAWREADNLLYISDNGPEVDDRLVKVEAGGNYGWPSSLLPGAIHRWNPPVAPTAVAFCEGAGFPESYQGRLFVGHSGPTYLLGQTARGKRIQMFTLAPDGSVTTQSDFLTYTGRGRATVVGLAFGPDGLYFTDLYGEDGFDANGITRANIYRVSYAPAISSIL
ncbi:MAG: PQQ-dependent sugar dehydrogenase [bacterium]